MKEKLYNQLCDAVVAELEAGRADCVNDDPRYSWADYNVIIGGEALKVTVYDSGMVMLPCFHVTNKELISRMVAARIDARIAAKEKELADLKAEKEKAVS